MNLTRSASCHKASRTADSDDAAIASGSVVTAVPVAISSSTNRSSWTPVQNALATWRGDAFALGQEAVFNPATYFDGGALHVHETPLQWLRADRQGIVILRHDLSHAYLAHCQRLACSDTGFAKKVKAWLQPRKPTVKILVEAQAEKAAAA